MQSDAQPAPLSKARLWTGRVISALPVLFFLMDGIMKLVKPPIVVKSTVELGYPENVILPIGIVLLVCTVLYVIPLHR
jgi:DoxX-like family